MGVALVSRACPICGPGVASTVFLKADVNVEALDRFAFASRKEPEYMHWELVRCGVCDLVFASSAPSTESLAESYRSADFASTGEAGYASRTYAAVVRPFLSGLEDRIGALDIGTGDGVFLQELLGFGFTDVVGVEPSEAPIRAASPTVRDLIKHDIFRPDAFPERSFRLVTCFQTIEHTPDPLGLTKDVFRILKPGGLFVMVGHNRRAVVNRLLGRYSPIIDVEHMQLFSRASFARLLQNSGFKILAIRPFVNKYPASYWFRLFPFPKSAKRLLIRGLEVSRLGVIPIPLPVGNLAIVAAKD